MKGSELSIAPMHRIIKNAKAERVSESAAKELAKALEDVGDKIAKEAMDYAEHAKRKTIQAKDIRIAVKKIIGE